jgi:hypothetical protein
MIVDNQLRFTMTTLFQSLDMNYQQGGLLVREVAAILRGMKLEQKVIKVNDRAIRVYIVPLEGYTT